MPGCGMPESSDPRNMGTDRRRRPTRNHLLIASLGLIVASDLPSLFMQSRPNLPLVRLSFCFSKNLFRCQLNNVRPCTRRIVAWCRNCRAKPRHLHNGGLDIRQGSASLFDCPTDFLSSGFVSTVQRIQQDLPQGVRDVIKQVIAIARELPCGVFHQIPQGDFEFQPILFSSPAIVREPRNQHCSINLW